MPEEAPPYGIIWNKLKAGRVVPFLGAGASLVGRKHVDQWQPDKGNCLPKSVELANMLADEANFPSDDPYDRNDLSKVSSYYADVSGRSTLRERLREVLNFEFQCGQLHEFLAAIDMPLVIVVTNYDTLMEQAFQKAGKPYDLVVYPADSDENANAILYYPHREDETNGEKEPEPQYISPNEFYVDLDETAVIFKMHGTIAPQSERWDHFVITEEDYVEFLSRMTQRTAIPSIFYQHFMDRSFLFLGYSLRDWNLRVVLKNLGKHLALRKTKTEKLPSWSIQHRPSPLEKRLWNSRDVLIFDTPLETFTTEMLKVKGG